jgi:hypothetical protein
VFLFKNVSKQLVKTDILSFLAGVLGIIPIALSEHPTSKSLPFAIYYQAAAVQL